jgi:L-threonylcarbamoyladenylate synthase
VEVDYHYAILTVKYTKGPKGVQQNTKKQITSAVAVLKSGGLVAFPTDTVFGLGALADNVEAIKRIYAVKQRPASQAMPLLLSSLDEVDSVAVDVSETARRLMRRFWPGGLTLVVKKAAWLPDVITAGGSSVAIRVPDHPVPLALIRQVGKPLVGTSANRSGEDSPLTVEEVVSQLGGKIDMIIDDGTHVLPGESTILDVTVDPPRIIRQGVVSRSEIEKITPLA